MPQDEDGENEASLGSATGRAAGQGVAEHLRFETIYSMIGRLRENGGGDLWGYCEANIKHWSLWE